MAMVIVMGLSWVVGHGYDYGGEGEGRVECTGEARVHAGIVRGWAWTRYYLL